MRLEIGDELSILGYAVRLADGGWQATYLGVLTESAKLNGCDHVLIDTDFERLKIRAIKNRIKAWSYEYVPPEEDDDAI
ncbi:hypothetical protein [Streptosporangium canum]|uniref:hypothetical protein n=1 Tax=Streptosporangium canum TaxID=324952 RepID=UPI0033A2513B